MFNREGKQQQTIEYAGEEWVPQRRLNVVGKFPTSQFVAYKLFSLESLGLKSPISFSPIIVEKEKRQITMRGIKLVKLYASLARLEFGRVNGQNADSYRRAEVDIDLWAIMSGDDDHDTGETWKKGVDNPNISYDFKTGQHYIYDLDHFFTQFVTGYSKFSIIDQDPIFKLNQICQRRVEKYSELQKRLMREKIAVYLEVFEGDQGLNYIKSVIRDAGETSIENLVFGLKKLTSGTGDEETLIKAFRDTIIFRLQTLMAYL